MVTDQPNTAEIRERWAAWNPAPMAPGGTILALCDALDATRTERERRSHAAEARIAELEAREVCNDNGPCTCNWRAVTAEARIAAALAWFDRADCTWTYRVEMARRALTEGTERGVLPE